MSPIAPGRCSAMRGCAAGADRPAPSSLRMRASHSASGAPIRSRARSAQSSACARCRPAARGTRRSAAAAGPCTCWSRARAASAAPARRPPAARSRSRARSAAGRTRDTRAPSRTRPSRARGSTASSNVALGGGDVARRALAARLVEVGEQPFVAIIPRPSRSGARTTSTASRQRPRVAVRAGEVERRARRRASRRTPRPGCAGCAGSTVSPIARRRVVPDHAVDQVERRDGRRSSGTRGSGPRTGCRGRVFHSR